MQEEQTNPYQPSRVATGGASQSSEQKPTSSTALSNGLLVGVMSNLIVLGLMCTLFACERGEAIRPMTHASALFLFAAFALVVGVPLSLIRFFSVAGRQRGIAVVAVLLNLSPFSVGVAALHFVCYWMELTLKP